MNRTRIGWLLAIVACLVAGRLAEPPLVPSAPAGPAVPAASGLVALLTDYGSDDPYPGVLKGVILSAAPETRIVDLTHDVPPFDIAGASYMLGRAAADMPPGTVFVCVVDPGVGTTRRKIALLDEATGRIFVGPDNGLFTDVLESGGPWRAFELTNAALARPGAESSTFHGRDWFGPVGARLAAGTPVAEVGPEVASPVRLPRSPARAEGDRLSGAVLFVDHYGNLLTNIPKAMAEAAGYTLGRSVEVRIDDGPPAVAVMARTYGDVPEGALLVTVHNAPAMLEVAVNMGHAGERLNARAGGRITLRRGAGR